MPVAGAFARPLVVLHGERARLALLDLFPGCFDWERERVSLDGALDLAEVDLDLPLLSAERERVRERATLLGARDLLTLFLDVERERAGPTLAGARDLPTLFLDVERERAGPTLAGARDLLQLLDVER